ncbi:ABC transporter permease [Limobrevibacterium gyesilva]|uniref:ABC transporter permease subunit n=1 Tax=Limobrevibacterium gyesilva TaxID=2991712 RepID=A0AA41YRU0_9PROT|nr:ABC transporter permease subunit [Limobrevibacterium gyesilva]MCW3474342.1 ABC transporter permease subunit [Limobrevibacterium gyesilva]
MATYFTLIGFGPNGWGWQLAYATFLTLSVSACAFATGLGFGTLGAWAKLSGSAVAGRAGDVYTTVVRGIPDLLVVYLFYFGGSQVMTAVARMLGQQGFWGLNGFMVGTLAVGIVSGAYQTEVIRGGYLAIPRGEIEAARAVGMGRLLMLRRIIAPRALRYAMPGIGNVWQQVLKESALISVTGLAEIMRQIHVGAGSTRLPFDFYITGFMLYLMLTTVSGFAFRGAEGWTLRSERRA